MQTFDLSPDSSFKRIYPTLEQTEVLKTRSRSVLIRALAGTGKTTTLAIKAADLIRQGASKILMLAYSEAGIRATRARLAQFVQPIPEQLCIMTVEQLCTQLLKEQGDPVQELNTELQRNLLIAQAHAALLQEQSQRDELEPTLAEFLAQPLDVRAFLAFEALAKQRLLFLDIERSGLNALQYCQDYELNYGLYRLLTKYERLRTGLNNEPEFYAPGDCTYALAVQLSALDFEDVFEPLAGRFDAVLFDELQDLDEAAMLVLRYLVRGGNGVFIGAGDFNQHILPGAFSVFGDGQSYILNQLAAGTELITINTTYRFGPAICRGLNPLFGVDFVAHYQNKSAWFEARTYASDEDCAQQLLAIHEAVQHELAQHSRSGADACLNLILRSPEDSLRLEWDFAHAGVHYACKGMKRFYQRRETALVLAIMWSMQGCSGGGLLSQGILSSAIEGLLRYVRRAEQPDQDVLANGHFDMQALGGDSPTEVDTRSVARELLGQQALMRRFLTRASFDPRAALASPVCEQLLQLPPAICADAQQLCRHPLMTQFFTQAPISQDELAYCLDSLKALGSICAGLSVDEFLGRLTLMVQSSIEQHQRQEIPSLQLLTVQACKGHEYEYVAVPLVERGRFPRRSTPEEAYRERNMLYVAMTRASKRLWLLEGAKRPVSPGPV